MIVAVIALLQSAATPAVSQPVAATMARASKPRQICHTGAPTGSRIGGKRVCATKQEWEQREREDRETLDRMAANTVPSQ